MENEQRSSTAANLATQSTKTKTSSETIKELSTLRTLIFRNKTEQLKFTTTSDKKTVPIETRISNDILNGTNTSGNKSKQTVTEKFTTTETISTEQEQKSSSGGQTLPDESVRSGEGTGQAEIELNGPPVATRKSGQSTNGDNSNNSGQSTKILIENNFSLSAKVLNESKGVNTEKSTTIATNHPENSFNVIEDDEEYSYYSDLYVDESRNILVPKSSNLPAYTRLETTSQSTVFTGLFTSFFLKTKQWMHFIDQ